MDIPQVTTVELHGASSIGRRKPPKLKSVDRTVSMIVDNYTPLTSAALSAKNAGPLVINMDAPSIRSSPNINEQLMKSHSQSSSNSMNENLGAYSTHSMDYQSSSLRKSSSFRRGETIDLPETSSSMTHLRKAPSFHANTGDENVKIVQLNRYHSVRHHPTTYPTTFHSSRYQQQQQQQQQLQQSSNESSQNLSARRNCSMHRSFHEPSPTQKQRTLVRRDAVNKSSSFNNDEQLQLQQSHMFHQQHSMQQQQQQQQRMHPSLESELSRSRSNSRNLDVRKPSPLPSPTMSSIYHSKSPILSPRPTSSNSLDQVLSSQGSSPRPSTSGASSSQRGLFMRQHTIGALNPQFLAPIPLLALDKSFEDIYQTKSPVFDTRKSYSLRYKNVAEKNSKDNRELFRAKKSKSFISDMDPTPDFPYTVGISPALSPGLSASGSVKKHHSPLISPSPQIRGSIMIDDIKRGSDSSDIIPPPVNFPIEFGTIDFNTIYTSYRQQKASTSSRRHKHRQKKSSLTNGKLDDDFVSESNKKRKRIVCIVMAVFLCLVILSVLAVIVTLTHFSVAQVQNQTRNVYTFSRDSPIHYTGGGGN